MNAAARKSGGFTLVEVMVSLVISSLVMAGIYGVYTIQQRTYTVQEQVTEMQQKIRAAMDYVSRETRMAGYDPERVCGFDIDEDVVADAESFSFAYCTDDGNLLRTTFLLDDPNDDAVMDLSVQTAFDDDDSKSTVLAEGVDAIEFLYLNADGAIETDLALVRTVKLSMLVRARYPDPKFNVDRLTYAHPPASAAPPLPPLASKTSPAWCSDYPAWCHDDQFHRRLLITSIQLRNNIL